MHLVDRGWAAGTLSRQVASTLSASWMRACPQIVFNKCMWVVRNPGTKTEKKWVLHSQASHRQRQGAWPPTGRDVSRTSRGCGRQAWQQVRAGCRGGGGRTAVGRAAWGSAPSWRGPSWAQLARGVPGVSCLLGGARGACRPLPLPLCGGDRRSGFLSHHSACKKGTGHRPWERRALHHARAPGLLFKD